MASGIGDLLWPQLRSTPPDAQAKAASAAVVAKLASPNWNSADHAVVLAEAQRIVDAEAERRRSADNKAAIYLAAIAAVLPLLASTETIFWDQTVGRAPPWLTAWPMLATVTYLGAAGLWAVRVLRVSTTTRVDVEDVVKLGRGAAKALATQHLRAAYTSRDSTNAKISNLKMTHEFVLRAAVAFALLLGTETLWSGVSGLAPIALEPSARAGPQSSDLVSEPAPVTKSNPVPRMSPNAEPSIAKAEVEAATGNSAPVAAERPSRNEPPCD